MVKAAVVCAFAALVILSSVTGALAVSFVSDTTWSYTCIAICATSGTASAVSSIPGVWNPASTGTWITSVTSNQNTSVLLNTIVDFTQVVHAGSGSVLTFTLWADDTARMFLTGDTPGVYRDGLDFTTTLGTSCANAPVGCTTANGHTYSLFLTGDQTVNVEVEQLVDKTPFGMLAEGSLTPVPEPATILLLGSALATAGVVSRRRFRKSGS